jgi:uncharacterized protein (TIRG00374 family)
LLRRKRFWFGLVITVAFLGFFLVRTDFGDIRHAFAGADLWLAFAVVPLYFVGFWIRTMRWRYLLRPVRDVATRRLYPVVLIGLMANNVAPARVGELVRAFLVGERETMSKSTALGTIAVDRAFDGLTLVAILGCVAVLSGANSAVQGVGVATAILFAIASSILISLALSPTKARGIMLRLIGLLPRRLSQHLAGLLDAFLSGLAALRSPTVLLRAALASCASWMIEAAMYYGVGEAFHLNVGYDVYLLITAAANLALSIFASPGGVGPFEVTTREVLVFFNVGGADASAYALALHALLLAPVVIVGLILLWMSHFSLRDIMGLRTVVTPLPTSGGVE